MTVGCRWLMPLGGLLAVTVSGGGQAMPPTEPNSAIPYVDLHVDLPYQYNYKEASLLRGTGQFSVDMAPRGGLTAVVLPLFVPFSVSETGPRVSDYEQSWQRIEECLKQQNSYAHPGEEPAAGQVRTFYSFEGMGPLGGDLSALEHWVQRGVRLFGLVHNQHNALAASSMDHHGEDFGLTELGRQMVARIYELGGIVDISHASDRAAADILKLALSLGQPVVASHSNVRRLMNHQRNLSDEQLDKIAETGGIIGVNFHSAFLVSGRRATLADVVKHMLYIARRVGANHVAIGSDFEGGIRPPRGLETLESVQHLVPALRAAGLTDAEVRAILGGNALRILAAETPSRGPMKTDSTTKPK
jgi:membrane dipeptidase